ncbi:hypothetical protein Cgig2_021057 [Carnegiea gigantea]|uniref:Protein RRC1 n=1 Tax=Carnegiea gigantea TaxID=171969 RepID=A0A9Q1JQ34_9CARY|nr:hypothetical protein Cgig2_021057 [Carnegiea gigantea]
MVREIYRLTVRPPAQANEKKEERVLEGTGPLGKKEQRRRVLVWSLVRRTAVPGGGLEPGGADGQPVRGRRATRRVLRRADSSFRLCEGLGQIGGSGREMSSFSITRKKTPFQKHREEKEAKKKRAEDETARLYEEFLESFQGDDLPGSKAFVRGGTINPNDKAKADSEGGNSKDGVSGSKKGSR